jgi:hypothetical protein
MTEVRECPSRFWGNWLVMDRAFDSGEPKGRRLFRIVFAGAALAYLVGAALWAQLIAARADDYGGSPGRWWLVSGALALGLVVARWPVVFVPLVLPLVAAGAGRGTNPDSDIPIAGEMLLIVMPVSIVAAAVGVVLSRLMRRAIGAVDRRA